MDGTPEGQVGESKVEVPPLGLAGTVSRSRMINVTRTKVSRNGNDAVGILPIRSCSGYRRY